MRDETAKYFFQELASDGAPIGERYSLNWSEVRVRVAYSCPKYPLAQLNHMRDLAHAAKGHPVDLCQWNKAKTGIEWSARITLQ